MAEEADLIYSARDVETLTAELVAAAERADAERDAALTALAAVQPSGTVYVVTLEPYHDNSVLNVVTGDIDEAVRVFRALDDTREYDRPGFYVAELGGDVIPVDTGSSLDVWESLDAFLAAKAADS